MKIWRIRRRTYWRDGADHLWPGSHNPHKVAREKALPFDLREPNQLTIQSIKNSEAGVDVHKAKDADDLFDKLGI